MTNILRVNNKKLKLHQTDQTKGCFCILATKKKKKKERKSVQLPELLVFYAQQWTTDALSCEYIWTGALENIFIKLKFVLNS